MSNIGDTSLGQSGLVSDTGLGQSGLVSNSDDKGLGQSGLVSNSDDKGLGQSGLVSNSEIVANDDSKGDAFLVPNKIVPVTTTTTRSTRKRPVEINTKSVKDPEIQPAGAKKRTIIPASSKVLLHIILL